MKPLHVGLIALVCLIGGAVGLKVIERRTAPVATVSQTPPATAAPAPAVPEPALPAAVPTEPPPAAVAAAPAKPSPAVRSASASGKRPPAVQPAHPVAPPQPVPAAASPQTAAVEPPAPLPAPAAEPEPPAPLPPAPAAPHQVTLNAGMLIPVRLVDGLSSERNNPGDTFLATLDKELVVDGFVIAERGARVEGRVVASEKGGKVRGVASLSVALHSFRASDGQNVVIQTDPFARQAESSRRTDATKVGAGAALGAVIGAIAGGGKGAAIGAGVGGGAGAGDVLLTRGEPARLASETRLTFRLSAPVTVTERRR